MRALHLTRYLSLDGCNNGDQTISARPLREAEVYSWGNHGLFSRKGAIRCELHSRIMESRRLSLIFKAVPILYLVYLLHLAVKQISFDHFLGSSSISFNDFPFEYTTALQQSTADRQKLQYDYTSYPPSPSPDYDIPPAIHFIFFENLYETHTDRTLIPSMGSKAPELCQFHNPNFTITTWNASASRALLETHYPWFLPTYDSYRYPIQRVDAIKYFILYHFGGIYMDLDIACRRPLTPLLRWPAWLPKATPLGLNNDLMASRAKHPLMERMVKRLMPRNRWLVFPYVTIFWSTGPQFASDMVKEWWSAGGAKGTDADIVRVLPLKFYSEEYTFFGHSPGGTWHEDDVAVVLWLVDRPLLVVGLAALALLACVSLGLYRRRSRRRTLLMK
ncbi:unnamed protein product [Cercospora beticola]|nr:unnamed protein product [Cercospora beticola]